ncbi:MAG: hypothetical protein COY81_01895 [Candidatus Pacebacteria bacterium CG_4_10_14_0_8_um_filter_43_12]|nr:MAG: hypothetical protein COU66_01190 [Candidatus Pacebacteria bacterium CG10_big_fil_rev_8_21_14_0_10_44_11]PIY79605.1 MAG: hypothetical protein COY81_01895 [Candidatus Pacebacteria bacterium CG_4_10_14_0_8_um_filter_43_12]
MRKKSTKKLTITAIIAAYNEQKNIRVVASLLTSMKEFSEVIVVDDGSDDLTAVIAASVKGVTVISLPKNMGKTTAVRTAVKAAHSDQIMLVDADLFGLEAHHLREVIQTYKQGFEMVILDYGNQELYLRKIFKSFPALSGVRIFETKYFKRITFKKNDRFELETRINDFYLDHKLSIVVVTGEGIHTPHKYQKYSFHKGLYLEAKALKEIFLSNGPRNIGKLVKRWWEINAKRLPEEQP